MNIEECYGVKMVDYPTPMLETWRENCVMYAAGMVELGLNPHVSDWIEEIETELNRRKQA